jgi:hypothetical protein
VNARRIRNVAKIVAVAVIDQYLSDGCEPDERLSEALNDVKVGILRSMSDRAHDQAEIDWRTYNQELR